jgi:hypothetical protein
MTGSKRRRTHRAPRAEHASDSQGCHAAPTQSRKQRRPPDRHGTRGSPRMRSRIRRARSFAESESWAFPRNRVGCATASGARGGATAGRASEGCCGLDHCGVRRRGDRWPSHWIQLSGAERQYRLRKRGREVRPVGKQAAAAAVREEPAQTPPPARLPRLDGGRVALCRQLRAVLARPDRAVHRAGQPDRPALLARYRRGLRSTSERPGGRGGVAAIDLP